MTELDHRRCLIITSSVCNDSDSREHEIDIFESRADDDSPFSDPVRFLTIVLVLLFFSLPPSLSIPLFPPCSSARFLAESQNHLVRRGQGLGRHKRENATEEGRTAHAGERGEAHDEAAASCGRQAGPQHAATAIVSPTLVQSRYASAENSSAEF